MRRKILIVDDNLEFISALKSMLQELLCEKEYLIETAFNGEQAIHRIKETFYNFIFMDIHMPCMDGIEATQTITRNYHTRGTTIIAVSFHADFEHMKRIIEAGARHYIRKDQIDFETLSKIFIPETINN